MPAARWPGSPRAGRWVMRCGWGMPSHHGLSVIAAATSRIAAWPEVPRGEPWKEGVLRRIGVDAEPGRFWKHLLGKVSSWTDLETPLIGAVEELIDFVTEPPGA